VPIETNHLRQIISDAFSIAYFAMISTIFYFVFGTICDPDSMLKAGANNAYVAIWLILYFTLIIKGIASFKDILKPLGPATCLALVSLVAYTINGFEDSSLRNLGCLYLSFLSGVVLAAQYPTDRFFHLFYRTSCVLAAFHLAMYPFVSHLSANCDTRLSVFGMPLYAGLFAHKNQCGLYFGMSFLIGAARYIAGGNQRTLKEVIFLGMHIVCIAMSGAISPLLSTFGALTILMVISATFKRPFFGVVAIMMVLAIAVVAFFDRRDILSMLGRDSGLTGRVALYDVWFGYFQRHPFVGYGYGEFFSENPSSVGAELNSGILYAHYGNFESGYMQAAIDFGICGVFIYLYMIVAATKRSVRYARESKAEYRLAPLALMLYIVFSSINEVYITLFNSVHVMVLSYLFTKSALETFNSKGAVVSRRRFVLSAQEQ
jgi:exopolysaccharide production protein ExoQ